jgi:spermidine synthase
METDPVLIHHQTDLGLNIDVFEKDNLRWLSFGDEGIQSIIDLDDPGSLHSPVYRAMLAVLLFIPTPERVLLLGTGGGVLARYFHHRQTAIHGIAVEISSAIVDIARQFFEFPTLDQGWQTVISDAQDYICQSKQHYDLIVLDIADHGSSPAWMFEPGFLEHCRKRLEEDGGVLVLNIIPENVEQITQALWNIRQAFDQTTVCISVPEHKNILVFAFNGIPQYCNRSTLDQRVPTLKKQWGLEFDQFLMRMKAINPRGSGIF